MGVSRGEADARATVARGACKTVGSAQRDIGLSFLYDFDEPKSLNFKHQINKFDAAPPECALSHASAARCLTPDDRPRRPKHTVTEVINI
jgi:hypothetical protein